MVDSSVPWLEVAESQRVAAALRGMRAFRHLTVDHLAALATLGHERTVSPGEVVFLEGEDADGFSALAAGGVEVSRHTSVGPQLVGRLADGDLVGELGFLDGGSRDATVRAIAPSRMLHFPTGTVRYLMGEDPGFSLALLRMFWSSLGTKLRQTNEFLARIVAPSCDRLEPLAGRSGERLRLDLGAKRAVLREQGLSTLELDLLAAVMRAERFTPQSVILSEGEWSRVLYLVAEGRVEVSRRLPGYGEEKLAVLGRGELFGEMSLVDDQPRSADVCAADEGCTVLSIDRTRLEEVFARDRETGCQFAELVCRVLARRVRSMNDLLVSWRVLAGEDEAPAPGAVNR